MPIQMTRAMRDDILNALVAALGPLDPATFFVGVAESFTDKGLDTSMKDFVEGTGAGFARQKITAWSQPHDLVDGRRAVDSNLLTFRPTAAGDEMQVGAWFAADALTAGNLLVWDSIVPPILLSNPEESIGVVARVTVDPNGQWVGETLVNG